MADQRAGWRQWWSDAVKNAAGNAIWAAVVLLGAWFFAQLPPIRAWLFSERWVSGWFFVLIGAGAALGGFLAGCFGRGRHSRVDQSEPVERARVHFARPRYEPVDLQVSAVRALRFFDGGWVSAEAVAQLVKSGSVQDVDQALSDLIREGWAADSMGHPIQYKLAGGGLGYAREHGFLTQAQMKEQDQKPKPD